MLIQTPLISVIIPIYNVENYLSRCLESVILQTYKNIEVILVNDGSVDATAKVVQKYLNVDPRLKYFYQGNSGPSVARNTGIKEAKGKYLAFIDADDWVSPEYMEKLIAPMMAIETDLVCGGYYEVNPKFPKGLKLHDFSEKHFNQNLNQRDYQSNIFEGVNGVLWAKLFKKEIFIDNNILLHPELRLSEDLIAVLEYSRYIKNVFILPDSIYFYNRLTTGGLSGHLNIEKYKNLKIYFEELDKFKEELYFVDLKDIKNKRKYSFMAQILQDHAGSKKQFYEIADILVENESPLDPHLFQKNKLNNFILNGIFKGHYFQSWMVARTYQILRSMKK